MKHLNVMECEEQCEDCSNKENCTPEKKENQRQVAVILDENLPDYRKMDLDTAFKHFYAEIEAKGLLEFMSEEPRAWVMLMNTLHKITAAQKIHTLLKDVAGIDIEADDIGQELGAIEQAVFHSTMNRYIKHQMANVGQIVQSLGGAGALSQLFGGGGRSSEGLTPDDIDLDSFPIDEKKPN